MKYLHSRSRSRKACIVVSTSYSCTDYIWFGATIIRSLGFTFAYFHNDDQLCIMWEEKQPSLLFIFISPDLHQHLSVHRWEKLWGSQGHSATCPQGLLYIAKLESHGSSISLSEKFQNTKITVNSTHNLPRSQLNNDYILHTTYMFLGFHSNYIQKQSLQKYNQ